MSYDIVWQITCQQIFLGSKWNEDSLFLLYQWKVSSTENYIFISSKWKYVSFGIIKKRIKSKDINGSQKYIKKKDTTFKVSNYLVDQSAREKIILTWLKKQESQAVKPESRNCPEDRKFPLMTSIH